MLVLTRKENERLLFPTLGMSLEVMRVQGRRVQLGIDAPADIPVVREEIADLKALEMTLDSESSARKLSDVSRVVREQLFEAATVLNQLHQRAEGDAQGQQLVLDLYNVLHHMQKQVDATLSDEPRQPAVHALLIDTNNEERELLSTCLRMGGFEVTSSPSIDDAMDFLSLHACPDFALIDSNSAPDRLVEILRSNKNTSTMKLFAIGEHVDGVDGEFPRPLCAERLIEEIMRRFSYQTAA